MIGQVRGKLLAKKPPGATVDVHGVGYEIQLPMTAFYRLPAVGGEVTLHTHFIARDDGQSLYGFTALADRDMFRALIKVNGVGPRMALALLGGMDSAALARTVRANDIGAIARVPGIGKKTAERLLLELRHHVGDGPADADGEAGGSGAGEVSARRDAEAALVGLGYKPQQAARAVAAAAKANPQAADSETLIRLTLKSLA